MEQLIQEQIAALQNELKGLSITEEQQKRLDEKFALEFNYNSNHIEGNTLTYTETKQLLQFDETGGNHTMREYEEMKASEVALELVKELAADDERPLTESFIKYLNQVLLVRPYWKEAQTPDGQSTRRKILVGDYKQQPNSVLLENGKMFDYASPAETPMLMHELLDWYRNEEEKGELQPLELAALLHYRFVCIHPFDDGNGRISRLLMNYVLYKNNMPPVIVKSDDKSNYRRALHDADSGNVESFVNYMAEQLIWSLELNAKAAKGESLEEVEDWKKELSVLKKSLAGKESIEKEKSTDVLLALVNEKINPLVKQVDNNLLDFRDLFIKRLLNYRTDKGILLPLKQLYKDSIEKTFQNSITVAIIFRDFKRNGLKTFNVSLSLKFHFQRLHYNIAIDDQSIIITKLYHQDFTQHDIETISNECGKIFYAKIEEQLNSSINA